MKKLLITKLVAILISLLTPELLKSLADKLLDWVEDTVLGTKSTVDDASILPLCSLIRVTFGIPDNDEGGSNG
jgi:hypothetical protein